MRSWMMGRLAGALLALLMVAVTTSTAFADPRDFVLVNDTSSIITHVFVSPSDVTDWGDDILGRDILEAGDSVPIVFRRFTPGNCLYDIKVVTKEGAEGAMQGVDLCQIETVSFHD